MDPIFVKCFWGDRHQGFEVLQHNLKYGLRATTDLLEFLRESCSLQDNYQKALHKLSRQAGLYTNSGSFTPCWSTIRQLLEKQSSSHLELHQQWVSIMKDAQRYFEEQTRRHKEFRDGEAATMEVVNSFQSATQQLQKARDTYHSRYVEYDKVRRAENVSAKELERAEVRLRKAQNDYKYMIERYNNSRNAFLDKMTLACSHFQEVESKHLEQMREFLRRYGQVWNSQTNEEVSFLCEYEQSLLTEKTVSLLLHQFALEKGTGTHEPPLALFEDGEVAAAFADRNNDQSTASSQRSSSRAMGERPPTGSSQSNDKFGLSSRKNSIPDLLSSTEATVSSNIVNETSIPDGANNVNSIPGSRRWDTGGFFFKKNRKKAANSESGTKLPSTANSLSQAGTVDWRSETPMERPVDGEGYSLPPEDIRSRSEIRDPSSMAKHSSDSSMDSSDDEDATIKGFPKVVIRPKEEAPSLPSGEIEVRQLKEAMTRINRDSPILSQSFPNPPAPAGGGRMHKGRATPNLRGTVMSVKQQVSNNSRPSESDDRKSPIDAWGACTPNEGNDSERENGLSMKTLPRLPTSFDQPLHETPPLTTDEKLLTDPFGSPLHSSEEKMPLQPSFLTLSSLPVNNHSDVMEQLIISPPLLPTNIENITESSNTEEKMPLKVPSLPPRPKINESPNPVSLPQRQQPPVTLDSRYSTQKNISGQFGVTTNAPLSHQPLSNNKVPLVPPSKTESGKRVQAPPSVGNVTNSHRPLPPLPHPSFNVTPPSRITSQISTSSRGPSPVPMGQHDPIPLAAATTEIYHARFHGNEGTILERQVDGELSIAFPAAVLRRFNSMQQLQVLEFQLLDSKGQLRNLNWDARFFTECRQLQSSSNVDPLTPIVVDDTNGSMLFIMNMVNLREFMLEKRELEPECKYFSVDLLKYQVHLPPETSPPPLILQTHWHNESPHEIHVRIDYSFQNDYFIPTDLLLTCRIPCADCDSLDSYFSQPEGVLRLGDGVLEWAFSGKDVKKKGSVTAKFTIKEEASRENVLKPQQVHAQFVYNDRQCSEAKFDFPCQHYRLSLYKRRIISGQYFSEPQDELQFL